MPAIAYLNGQFLPLEEANVSIEDRGFQFGDGVYEVIRGYGGSLFRLEDHLSRLERSAQSISISVPFSQGEWRELVQEGIERSGYGECKVYIQLTRGVAPREHRFPYSARTTVVMTFREISETEMSFQQRGVHAVTLPDLRWALCSIKSLNLLPNILARQEANEAGAFEAILVKDGFVTEGTSSNVCLVMDGTIVTPSLSDHLLAGVTRAVVLELARQRGLPVEERNVREAELRHADELFLIGTTIEVVPVSRLNHDLVGDGTPGKVTQAMRDGLRRCIESEIEKR